VIESVPSEAAGEGQRDEGDEIDQETLRTKEAFSRKPVVILVVGMAGSGKTTFMSALVQHLKASKTRFYSVNLDPAVLHLPYTPNIDIRETVKYKDVMAKWVFVINHKKKKKKADLDDDRDRDDHSKPINPKGTILVPTVPSSHLSTFSARPSTR